MIIQGVVYIGCNFHIAGNQFAVIIRKIVHALHFEDRKIMNKLTVGNK